MFTSRIRYFNDIGGHTPHEAQQDASGRKERVKESAPVAGSFTDADATQDSPSKLFPCWEPTTAIEFLSIVSAFSCEVFEQQPSSGWDILLMNTDFLVQPLFSNPIDIVGDVHGEIDALRNLLDHLGYADNGAHPEERRLVFLGDLTDRGPNSPAVVEKVKSLVESDRAQCVLGNHDLNILLGHRNLCSIKHDNHWFFGESWSLDGSDEPTPAILAADSIRQTVLDLFKSLPLVLERDDLRVVHACWDDSMVEIASQSIDVVSLYQQYAEQIDANHVGNSKLNKIDKGLEQQNLNPVKVLTSGKERRIAVPFEASGKWRYEERVRWWEEYNSDPLCVFGHYSIYREQARTSPHAICVDFAVAKRWQ